MKLKTHAIFSTGLLTLINSQYTNFNFSLILAGIISIIANSLIDMLGHNEEGSDSKEEYCRIICRIYRSPHNKVDKDENKDEKMYRSPLTHTVYTSIAWGIVSTIIPLALLTLTQSTYEYNYHHLIYEYNYYHLIPLMIIDGIIVGPSHMFLDAFTEAGIFVKKNGKWKRAAIAHFKYDNPVLNGLAILAGIIMLIISAKAY
ncbi:MAG: DUF1286 domain-containing protein [Sulfolobaceae archaeon]